MTKPAFREGEVVMYFSETGKLLGPFTVYLGDDGVPDLWYVDPKKLLRYPHWRGEHVHAIIGDRIYTIGWSMKYGIDPARIRCIPQVGLFPEFWACYPTMRDGEELWVLREDLTLEDRVAIVARLRDEASAATC